MKSEDYAGHFIKLKHNTFASNQKDRNAKDWNTFEILIDEVFFVESIQWNEGDYIRYNLLTSDVTFADITFNHKDVDVYFEVID